jgi:beta-lactamase regulating signal transducer with metallopeptidase domain
MELLSYLLKVSACLALFFVFYLLVLRKLTFFRINRFFLLFSLLISLCIPALQFKIERLQDPLLDNTSIKDESRTHEMLSTVKTSLGTMQNADNLDFVSILSILYWLIVVALLSVAAVKLFRLISFARSSTHEINGLKLVSKTIGFTNCSFFNYVFINRGALTDHELEVLLRHEEVHAKEFHTIDKIILMILKAVLWFNPIIYLYDKMLEQTHEFEADQKTSQNFGTEPYAHLLLKLAVVKSDMPFVHNFVKSPIKQRIYMLFNSKSRNMKKLIYLLALPIALCLVWGFTVKIVYADQQIEKIATVPKIIAKSTAEPFLNKENIARKAMPQQAYRATTDSIKSTEAIEKQNIVNLPVENSDEDPTYTRYPYTNDKGEIHEMVKITLKSGTSAAVEVKKGGRALIIIKGIRYTEDEVKLLSKDKFDNIKSISAVDEDWAMRKYYPELTGKYDGVLQLPSLF